MGTVRRLRFVTTATAATLILTAALAAPATAITDGEPDGNAHPFVVLMLAKDADGQPLWRCSGTLISPTVYLTAGHCTEAPAAHAEIFLSTGPILTDTNYKSVASGGTGCTNPAVTGYPCHGDVTGTPYTHPAYNPAAFFYRDLGVVVLDTPVVLSTYGVLPALNQLDALKVQRGKQDVTFTAVGYGLQKSFPDAAGWKEEAVKVRMVAYPKLNQINGGIVGDYSLLLSNNAATGGTCFGDSGGANFIGDSNVLAGVTSFGLNSTCGGTGGVFRVDRSWSLDWIATFLD